MNAAVFLDRDNTIIHNDGDLGDPDQVRLIQGASTAIASLCGLGYKVVVVTNQGGVARGKYSEEDVVAVNDRISQLVAEGANGAKIERFYFCPYHPKGTVGRYRKEHPNRKPSPGMLLDAAKDMNLDLSQSWTIGDQVRDVQAGLAAGTRAILLRLDADRLKPFDPREHPGLDPTSTNGDEPTSTPDFYARNLVEAVRLVAQQRKPDVHDSSNRSGKGQRKWDAAAVAKLQRARTKPPTEHEDLGDTTAAPEPIITENRQASRPFKPWGAPQSEAPQDEASAATATAPPAAEPRDKPARVAPIPAKPTPSPAPAPTPASTTHQEPEPVRPAPVLHEAEQDEKTLRLILQELRSQRGMDADFSYLKIMAIVLQTVAGACLLGALWLGSGDDQMFLRLGGAAILAQLAVVTTLLWDR